MPIRGSQFETAFIFGNRVCHGHEDEYNGRERYLNGQVVGARVNEAGLDVTEDDGRGGNSTQQRDRDEKVMGKRDCDEFEEWDDD